MVFASILIGQNVIEASGFAGGDITENDMEAAMTLIATSAPADVNSTSGGQLILGGNDYGNYDYSVWNGGSYTLGTTFINTSNDRHACIAFKGNTTLNLNNFTTSRKVTTCIYVDGNLTITNNIYNRGCIQASSGLFTTNPSSFPLTSTANMTGSCGNGGGGGGGSGNGGAGGIFSGGAGAGGGPTCGTTATLNGVAYGGRGGYNTTGGFSGVYSGGGAGNPGGPGYTAGGSGFGNSGGTGTGGTFILFVNGTLTQSSGQISCGGINGGAAAHYSGTQSRGGGGSGGGRIWGKRVTGNFTSTNVSGGGGGSADFNGGSGGSGSVNYFT